MTAAHTPGPWGTPNKTVLVRGISWLGFANYESAEATANGNVILASPDLLDACERLCNQMAHMAKLAGVDISPGNVGYHLGRAAIAKARGQ